MTSLPGVEALLLMVLVLRGVDTGRGEAEMEAFGSLLGFVALSRSQGKFRGMVVTCADGSL